MPTEDRARWRQVLRLACTPPLAQFLAGRLLATHSTWVFRVTAGWAMWEATRSPAMLGLATVALLAPQMLLVPCVGFGPGGLRLGYGGGFYDRTLATLEPRPFTVGVGYAHGFIPWLAGEAHDVPLDAILTEDGLAWQKPD